MFIATEGSMRKIFVLIVVVAFSANLFSVYNRGVYKIVIEVRKALDSENNKRELQSDVFEQIKKEYRDKPLELRLSFLKLFFVTDCSHMRDSVSEAIGANSIADARHAIEDISDMFLVHSYVYNSDDISFKSSDDTYSLDSFKSVCRDEEDSEVCF